MSQLSDKHLPAMIRAAKTAGIPLGELKPLNPVTQQGPRALALITALEMNDPATLAEMRQEAREGATVETMAVRAGLIEMTPSAHQALMASDPDYVREHKEKAIKREADQLATWDRLAKEGARRQLIKQHGSEAAADRYLAQQEASDKAKAEQAARDAESARQLEKRIAAKQAEIAQQARIAQASVATGVTG